MIERLQVLDAIIPVEAVQKPFVLGFVEIKPPTENVVFEFEDIHTFGHRRSDVAT